ncbi:hypothetical protein DL98DRAFT_523467 [Cadophora sp. DSE1049]|nr:hypothetical protein DL98DRAFT_523467 [Cadophora sp. DSE1049]
MAPPLKSSAEATQISDLAFNVNGWALEDGMIGEERGLIINARCPSGSYLRLIQTINNPKTASSSLFRSTLSFTAAEIAPSSDHTGQYLIVGYALRSPDSKHDHHNVAHKSKELEPVGTRQPRNVISWDTEAPLALVVTPMTCIEGNHLKYFALMEPNNGLCTPYIVRQDKVFFRAEFRSMEMTTYRRRYAWSTRIRDAISKLKSPEKRMVGSSGVDVEANSKEGDEGEELVASSTSIPREGSDLQDFEGNAITEASSTSSTARCLTEEKATTLPVLSETMQICPPKDLVGPGPGPGIEIDMGLARQLQVRLLFRKAEVLEQREREIAAKEKTLEERSIQLKIREQALQQQRTELEDKGATCNTRKTDLDIVKNVLGQRQPQTVQKMQAALDKEKAAMNDAMTKGVKRRREGDDDLEQEALRLCSGGQNCSRG